MPDDAKVGVSDIPKTIKGGFPWFESIGGRSITIEGVSLIGNNKGSSRYAAVVTLASRDMAKSFARKLKEKNLGPRAKVLNDEKDVEEFRAEMMKNNGWSADAPDGDKAITPNSGADIRGDASGFKHGFNPRRPRSPLRSGSRSPRRRSPSRRRRSPSSSPPKKRSRSPPRRRQRSRSRSPRRSRSPPKRRDSASRDRRGGGPSREGGGRESRSASRSRGRQ